MSLVVFMRAVNVGGHKVFRPSAFVDEIAHLNSINVGAAGTIVIRRSLTEKAARDEFNKRLQFEAKLFICNGRDILALIKSDPFSETESTTEIRFYVSVLDRRPTELPRFPLFLPAGDQWQFHVAGISGRFVMIVSRRIGKPGLDINAFVEKQFGVSATTRNWNTLVKIGRILDTRAG